MNYYIATFLVTIDYTEMYIARTGNLSLTDFRKNYSKNLIIQYYLLTFPGTCCIDVLFTSVVKVSESEYRDSQKDFVGVYRQG